MERTYLEERRQKGLESRTSPVATGQGEIRVQNELLRNELLAEVDSIAPILAEHASLSEKLGRQDAPSVQALRTGL
jgi:hypothetical protein